MWIILVSKSNYHWFLSFFLCSKRVAFNSLKWENLLTVLISFSSPILLQHTRMRVCNQNLKMELNLLFFFCFVNFLVCFLMLWVLAIIIWLWLYCLFSPVLLHIFFFLSPAFYPNKSVTTTREPLNPQPPKPKLKVVGNGPIFFTHGYLRLDDFGPEPAQNRPMISPTLNSNKLINTIT
jgi:hypothetical protein